MSANGYLTAPLRMTGNLIVMFEPGRSAQNVEQAMADTAGVSVAHSTDFGDDADRLFATLDHNTAINFDRLGIAVMKSPEEQQSVALASRIQDDGNVRFARPEYWMFAQDDWRQKYDKWMRDGLKLLTDMGQNPAGLASILSSQDVRAGSQEPDDTVSPHTWGIGAIGANHSKFSGKGIKIAILDTGIDVDHPDFATRMLVSKSFVPLQGIQDFQGHGTHCAGTACGSIVPSAPRYGIAHEADLHIGKVLDDTGAGQESWVIAGINWAVERGCEIVSVSLGRAVQVDEPPDPLYESIGEYALENGCLVVAAAGNQSKRPGQIEPVMSPANATTIMAVGAVDERRVVARFSCGGLNKNGGEINLVAPGVDIFSSFPMPRRYKRMSGTSMAAPHVAGIAALIAEANPKLRGRSLWTELERVCQPIAGTTREDTGYGFAMSR